MANGEWRSPAAGEASMLVSTDRYADFFIEVEFYPDENVNSGVFIRCQDPTSITALNCYEVNIWDEHPRQEFRTGSIVMRFAPPLAQVETVNKWNLLTISANNDLIEVRVNGIRTAEYRNADFQEGHVALQWGGTGVVRFRNFSLKKLD